MKKFVLLTMQRSGSTWVIDYLNSHPKIVAYSEMFLENAHDKPKYGGAKDKIFWSSYLAKNREHNKLIKEKKILNQYLDSLFACEQAQQAIGFKLMYGQAGALPDLNDYLK